MVCLPCADDFFYRITIFVGEEYRACVCVAGVNVVDSVLLLVSSCQLVLFDAVFDIIVD